MNEDCWLTSAYFSPSSKNYAIHSSKNFANAHQANAVFATLRHN